jgi:3-isopropylmalate dehydrogenase
MRSGRVTLVDKANVLATSQLWRKVVQNLRDSDFQDIELSTMYVDNAAMQLILNPTQFDVILTENMFGDILSDEASILGGSLGLLPSASLGTNTPVYEPAHGSYPQAAGKNIANPMATLLSVAMMLETECDAKSEANQLRSAIAHCIKNGFTTSDVKNGTETTQSVTDKICQLIASDTI